MELISTDSFVESPFIIAKIGNYTFGSYTGTGTKFNGALSNITYPNYMKSIKITKINGQVNTYTLQMSYAITPGDDPNMFEKVFSSVRNDRKITLSYGDWNCPTNIYKNEVALITSVKSNVVVANSRIDYTIECVSTAKALDSVLYDFPERKEKPSNVIKEIVYHPNYGVLDVFDGMIVKSKVLNNNLIASDDKSVKIPAKKSISINDYLKFLVENMISESNGKNSELNDSIYSISVRDDTLGKYGGPYFMVIKTPSSVPSANSVLNAWEIDVGYPGKNFVTQFNIEENNAWSILYDYKDKINVSDKVYKIDNDGNIEVENSSSLLRSRKTKVSSERNKNWWTEMTRFPIKASITIKGLIRPTILMDYVKLNVLFYGKKHISSGLYVITKQEDTIDKSGYRTTLSLLRIKEDKQ